MNEILKEAMSLAAEKIPDPRDSLMRPSNTPEQQEGNPLESALKGEKKQNLPNQEKQQEALRKTKALSPLA